MGAQVGTGQRGLRGPGSTRGGLLGAGLILCQGPGARVLLHPGLFWAAVGARS